MAEFLLTLRYIRLILWVLIHKIALLIGSLVRRIVVNSMLSRSVITRVSLLLLKVIRFTLRVVIIVTGSKGNLSLNRVLCHLIVVDRLIPIFNRSNTVLKFCVISSQIAFTSLRVLSRIVLIYHCEISVIVKDTSRFVQALFAQQLELACFFDACFALFNNTVEFCHVFFVADLTC